MTGLGRTTGQLQGPSGNEQEDMILDLFRGPGGWSEGLRKLGLRDVGIEWDMAANLTARAAGHVGICADVAAYPTAPFVGKVKGLIASPPCQDFSLAGKGAGIAGDRGQLVWQVLRWADALRPQWIACEQVPPVEPIWKHMAHVMRGWGYRTWVGTLNAADYGVPQTRRRAFLLASLTGPVQPPAPTHGKDASDGLWGTLLPWVTMAEALGWGMSDRPYFTLATAGGLRGGADEQVGGSGARRALYAEREAGRWVVRTGANSMKHSRTGSRAGDGGVVPYERSIDLPAPTLDSKVGSAWHIVSAGVTGEGRPKNPATTPEDTLTGKGTAYWTDGDEKIRVSTEEASALQSFPAGYPWQGTATKQYQQIGNAVPPLLAAHVLSALTGIPLREQVAA